MPDLLAADHRAAFACPTCRSPLTTGMACESCQRVYVSDAGYLDFAPDVRMKPGLGPFYLQDPLHVPRYEQQTRVAFLDIMGENWEGDLTPGKRTTTCGSTWAPLTGWCWISAAAPATGPARSRGRLVCPEWSVWT